jgi:hypothetical protein
MVLDDGSVAEITATSLRADPEAALRAMAFAVMALATGLTAARLV